MTKKQLVTWLANHGIDARGRECSYGYLITKVNEDYYEYNNQRAAHLAAIDAFLKAQGD